MTELAKMQRAKMHIDKLVNGINPIDDTPAADSDIINNVRLSRCLFYVSVVLRQVIDNHGVVGKSKSSKKAFSLSDESISKFSFSTTPIPVSEITKRLNALADLDAYYKLKHTAITSWLIEIGALESKGTTDGRSIIRPTEQGKELGISTEKRTGMNGEYVVVVYNKEAQQFIVDNIVPHEHSFKRGSAYSEVLSYVIRHQDSLIPTLTAQQKETFEKLKDCEAELHGMNEREAFISGFKLAARIMTEVLCKPSED